MGQLAMVLRSRYLADIRSYTKVAGLPFRAAELAEVFTDIINDTRPEGSGETDHVLTEATE